MQLRFLEEWRDDTRMAVTEDDKNNDNVCNKKT